MLLNIKMTRRTTRSNSSSIMVSDITASQIFPLATSSPRSSGNVTLITSDEIEEAATLLKKEFKIKLQKELEEEKKKIALLKEKLLLGWENANSIATAADLKELRKLFAGLQNCSIDTTVNSNRKVTRTILENESALPAIPEEANSPGKYFDCEIVNENVQPILTKTFPDSTTTGKAAKKIKIVTDKSDEEDDSVFKKPTGRGKRTLKNSQLANEYQTPKMKRTYNVASVTPGPNSHRPVNILRQPNPGEMAISMTGSPLLIANNNIANNVPQISIPLSDGRVMTVLADEALDPDMSFCSDIDTETRKRLEILQKLLANKTRNVKH